MSEISSIPFRLENEYVRVLFKRKNGAPESLFNVTKGTEYFRDNVQRSGFFHLRADSLLPPSFLVDTGRKLPFDGAMDQTTCELESYEKKTSSEGEQLILRFLSPGKPLEPTLTVTLPPRSFVLKMSLSIANQGEGTHRIRGSFPYLRGLGIGDKPKQDLGIAMFDRAYPGEKAWKRSGGAFGKKVSMQWQCAYDCDNTMGLAIISKDCEALPKALGRFAAGMSISYPLDRVIKPGETIRFPDAEIVVYSGSWYKAAETYGKWFSECNTPRKAPDWVAKGLAVRSSDWFPPPTDSKVRAHELASPKRSVNSFRDMPRLYLDDFADLKEHAMWNSGINVSPETYGPWMSSGFIDFREDLGGAEAFRKGVTAVQKMGRRVGMYVAGYGIRKKSPLFAKESWKRYAIINRWGIVDTGGYKKGFFCCHGYKPWQENIIRACRMLAEQGVDAIRLDELGQPFKPCFNRHHKHDNPYDSVKWSLELLKAVRDTLDEINPRILISTEFFNDQFHRYANAALVMAYAGTGIDVMRIALPSYLAYSYHGGAGETVLTGAIPERTGAVRRAWPWSRLPSASRPKHYNPSSTVDLRWHEILPSFGDALQRGKVADQAPFVQGRDRWKGHLWLAESYALVTGGYDDGTPLEGEQLLTIPGCPSLCTEAWEIDLQTLRWRKREIHRVESTAQIALSSGLCALFLPLESTAPLALAAGDRPLVRQGETITMEITLLPSSSKAAISAELSAPGILSAPKYVSIPGTIEIPLPSHVEGGNYYCELKGSILPFRRWFTITEQ